MSLANISLIDLNKSVSAPLGGVNAPEESELGDIFLNLLKGLKSSKNINAQIEDGLISKDTEETKKLAEFIAEFNSSQVFEQGKLTLDENHEFEGLEDLIAVFKAQVANNQSLMESHENSVEEPNKDVQAFLSLVADLTKQVPKNDEVEIYFDPHLEEAKQDGIEAKPLELPQHLRTPNAAYPNGEQQFSFSASNFPIQMHASIKGLGIVETSTPVEKTIGVEGKLSKINKIEETVSLPAYEVKSINLSFPREKAENEHTKDGPIRYNTSLGRSPLGAVETDEVSHKEHSSSLDQQRGTLDEKTVSLSRQEVKSLTTQNSAKELSDVKKDENQILKKAPDQNTKQVFSSTKVRHGTDHYSNSFKGKSVEYDADETDLTSSRNLRGVEERRLVVNGTFESTKYKTFSEDAFRPVAATTQKQKASSKSQVKANFAVDEVVTSFARTINLFDNSKLTKNKSPENQVAELGVESFTPRSLAAQPPNSTVTGSNPHSLETLEKWVDSQLDLNSRGWVSNLSKSMLSALNRGHQRITFTLSPETLGKVNVTFAQGIKGLEIRINAERQATASLINDAEAKLVSSIETAGHRVASVSCSSSNLFEHAYNSGNNPSSDTNHEGSNENRKFKNSEPDQSIEKTEDAETVGKPNDDDTIVNITI